MISTLKAALMPAFGVSQAPSRESLRKVLARERSAQKGAMERPRLVLASASPRRMTLLAQVGITPDALRPSSIDESAKRGEMPRRLVSRLARAKAEAARDQLANERDIADAFVLAADTVVAVGRKILMKPNHVEEAMASLQLLSGRTHKVLTSVCLITPDDRVRTKIVDTRVRFRHLTRAEIEAYIASREWRGKAGGYAIQGLAGSFVQRLVGSYTNVVGLPVTEVVGLLSAEGYPIHFNWLKFAEVDRD
ncbi:MAG: Maf family nucleotide pyrophosphatase [Hyphomicrobium sp.]